MKPRLYLALPLHASLALACGNVWASGLQVAPISLTLQARESAQGLWLSNTGTDVIHAQVRVYHWIEQYGEQQLAPSRGLVISPPMVEIKPGDKQLVRVIRVGAPPSGSRAVEDAYRLAIDELPIDTQGKQGLQFVLHYTVPVFVEPVGTAAVSPQLQWSLLREGNQAVLQVANSGTGHAQLANLDFVDHSGHRITLGGGLFGYVLPGATMRWTLKQPAADFAGGGTLEARINDAPVTQTISLADRAH